MQPLPNEPELESGERLQGPLKRRVLLQTQKVRRTLQHCIFGTRAQGSVEIPKGAHTPINMVIQPNL